MKKTIKINLTGMIFHIDEDAYEKLKKYLDAIGRHFSDKAEGEEILRDIESRIAELFQEKLKKQEEVISIALVDEIIGIMGDPEEIIDTGQPSGQERTSYSGFQGTSRRSRRLYRDPENSVIGGVCGGLGAYFNIDPLIFRVLFIVFFFFGGASILLYLILWIVLPRAETAAQKLEMQGEPVNVSNIERKIREEYETAKENVKAAANSEQAKKTKKAAGNFFSELGKILLVLIKVILIIIGTGFILAGIGLIIGLFSGAFVGLHFFPFGNYEFSLGEFLTPFTDPVNITLLILSLTVLFLIPVIAMIYGLVSLIFSIKSHNRGLTIGAVMLWIVALLMTLGILAMETGNFSDSGISESSGTISITSDTLFIATNTQQKETFEDNLEFDFDLDSEWYITKDLDRIYGSVELDIEEAKGHQYLLEIEKYSKGRNMEDAEYNAEKLNYEYTISNNVLVIDPYFFLDKSSKWRFPKVKVTVEVPEGKYIFLEKETKELLEDVYNVDHISDWRMSGKMWKMTDRGLKLVED
ncbi:MAG: PspC domain-containing protein [Bacteroidales bacterium]|nr:PspC domain-containing protein [Bacteroidales bacterium]